MTLQFLIFKLQVSPGSVDMQKTVDPVLDAVGRCKISYDERGVIVDRVKGLILVPVQVTVASSQLESLKQNLSPGIASVETGSLQLANKNPEFQQRERSTEEEVNDVLVVGTVGETTNQFVRIRQRKTGDIYIENRYKPEGPHFSYHASGEMHSVYVNGQGKLTRSTMGKGPPIAQFQGKLSLGAWVIYAPALPIWKQLTPSPNRKTQVILRLDIARLSGDLNLNFWLFERGREDLLQEFLCDLKKMPVEVLGYLVVKDTSPWLLIAVMTV